jgi:hypothetical protein
MFGDEPSPDELIKHSLTEPAPTLKRRGPSRHLLTHDHEFMAMAGHRASQAKAA